MRHTLHNLLYYIGSAAVTVSLCLYVVVEASFRTTQANNVGEDLSWFESIVTSANTLVTIGLFLGALALLAALVVSPARGTTLSELRGWSLERLIVLAVLTFLLKPLLDLLFNGTNPGTEFSTHLADVTRIPTIAFVVLFLAATMVLKLVGLNFADLSSAPTERIHSTWERRDPLPYREPYVDVRDAPRYRDPLPQRDSSDRI